MIVTAFTFENRLTKGAMSVGEKKLLLLSYIIETEFFELLLTNQPTKKKRKEWGAQR